MERVTHEQEFDDPYRLQALQLIRAVTGDLPECGAARLSVTTETRQGVQ